MASPGYVGHLRNTAAAMGPAGPSARDTEIFREVLRGRETMAAIGKRYHLTGERVGQIAREVARQMSSEYRREIDRLRAEHTQRLMDIYSDARSAWEKSTQNAERTTTRGGGKGGKQTEKTVELQSGNPAFLGLAMKALEDVRKIWGADIPPAVEPSGLVRVAGRPPGEALAELRLRLVKALGMKADEGGLSDDSSGDT